MKQYKTSFIFPILFTFCLLLDVFFLQQLKMEKYLKNYGVIIITLFFSKIVSGLFGFGIQKLLSIILRGDDKPEITNVGSRESYFMELLYYFIISILDLLNWSYYFYPLYIKHDSQSAILEFIPKGFILLASSLFCKQLLNYKIYRHHFVGLVIYGIGMIILFVLLLMTLLNQEQLGGILIKVILGIACCIGTSVKEIAEKWLMYFKFKNPFWILLYEGIIGAIGSILFFIVFNDDTSNISVMYSFDFAINKWWIIVFGIVTIFLHFFNIQLNNKFSPSFRAIADTIFSLEFYMLWDESLMNRSIIFIGLIPMFIGSLIYNEIIVLPFLSLDQFTKAAVDERVRIEQLKLNRDSMMDLLPS